MIKLLDILENKILIPRRSPKERQKNYLIATQKKIQQYIKDGSKGDLDLGHSPITSLPDNLKVGGSLYLDYGPITSLPNNLKVEGNLFLEGTKLTFLPDNLKVRGSLVLKNTPITSLPDNLQVGHILDLDNTKITSLPNDLQVRKLNIPNTPLVKNYTAQEIENMIPNSKYTTIYPAGKDKPNGLTVIGNIQNIRIVDTSNS